VWSERLVVSSNQHAQFFCCVFLVSWRQSSAPSLGRSLLRLLLLRQHACLAMATRLRSGLLLLVLIETCRCCVVDFIFKGRNVDVSGATSVTRHHPVPLPRPFTVGRKHASHTVVVLVHPAALCPTDTGPHPSERRARAHARTEPSSRPLAQGVCPLDSVSQLQKCLLPHVRYLMTSFPTRTPRTRTPMAALISSVWTAEARQGQRARRPTGANQPLCHQWGPHHAVGSRLRRNFCSD
jgi:hypothetical protein